jgi:hypothetical protein
MLDSAVVPAKMNCPDPLELFGSSSNMELSWLGISTTSMPTATDGMTPIMLVLMNRAICCLRTSMRVVSQGAFANASSCFD